MESLRNGETIKMGTTDNQVNINPHLRSIKEDTLYHIGLTHGKQDLKKMFGDVKFVCMGGTPHRMELFANYIGKIIDFSLPTGACLNDISKNSHRYSMFKVGPVLSISHGMGVPSLSILMHEVVKLLWHAGVYDATFFRIGTCGGIGLDPGSVVVSTNVLDGRLQPYHETIILGEVVSRKAEVDQRLAQDLVQIGRDLPFNVVSGKTVCTNDFYEGQARLDGAFCEYSSSDKDRYMLRLKEAGVTNIEMESTAFTALTHKAGFKSAVVCVTLLDRLNEDQITPSKETMLAWQNRPQKLVAQYIKRCLSNAPQLSNENVGLKDLSSAGKSKTLDNLRQRTVSSNSDISPSSSMATLTTYEDEQSREKLGAGGSRIRNDSMSTITGVRFDAHLNN